MKHVYTALAALVLAGATLFVPCADASNGTCDPVTGAPNNTHQVPEPATLILLGAGLAGIYAAKRAGMDQD